MPFTFKKGPMEGLVIVEPRIFPDDRGFFMETYKASDFAAAGICGPFVQDNHSRSCKGTIRGLHFQKDPHAQGKLIRVTRGKVWDVAVDIRPTSTTRGQWFGIELSEYNHTMFWIPPGFAHGFLALEDASELQYKCTTEYHAASDAGIRWNDPEVAIVWPIEQMHVLVSPKDASLPLFLEYLRDR